MFSLCNHTIKDDNYSEVSSRIIKIKDDDIYLIFPFINISIDISTQEIFLDNNAYIRTNWLNKLSESTKFINTSQININITLPLIEQYLSNYYFRKNLSEKIDNKISELETLGIPFDSSTPSFLSKEVPNFAKSMAYNHKLFYLYLIILKKIIDTKNNQISIWEDKLENLFTKSDVPKFNGIFALAALILTAKKHQDEIAQFDTKEIFSYLDNFFAFQKKKREKDFINIKYLKNRAADLFVWYALPTLICIQQYHTVGIPMIATGDKILHKILFPLLPNLYSQGKVGFSFDPRSTSDEFNEQFSSLFRKFCSPVRKPDSNQKQRCLENLFNWIETEIPLTSKEKCLLTKIKRKIF